jgi:soluble lytic murein transglycosylase-like protein
MIRVARATAKAHALPEDLVCAVCEHESNWQPWAFKPEPAFEKRYVDPIPRLALEENWGRSMSWGLMQIMGQTARELGFKYEYLSELCDPPVGIEYGCRKLERAMRLHPDDVRAALLVYNGGADPQYPALVLARLANYDPGPAKASA